jgi:hypothetical protein
MPARALRHPRLPYEEKVPLSSFEGTSPVTLSLTRTETLKSRGRSVLSVASEPVTFERVNKDGSKYTCGHRSDRFDRLVVMAGRDSRWSNRSGSAVTRAEPATRLRSPAPHKRVRGRATT